MLDTVAKVVAYTLAWFLAGILTGIQLKAALKTVTARVRPGGREGRRPPRRRDDDGGGGGGAGIPGVETYVGNLAYDVSDKDLGAAFRTHGKVVSARVIRNRMNGKSKGYGFVNMQTHDEALAAIKALDGSELKGRKIVVNEARSRSRDD